MADTTIITKLSNGNVLVDTTGNQYTLNPDMQVFKDLNDDAVEVRDKSGSKQDEFLVDDVLEVVREDATVVPIPDQDTLFNELSTFFFFKLTGAGTLPADAVQLGNTIIVSKQGDDATGVRESVNSHFFTIQAAVDAAQNGDRIEIYPGVYDELIDIQVFYDNLTVRDLTQNLYFYFHENAVHTYTGLDNGDLYHNTSVQVGTIHLRWDGRGIFNRAGGGVGLCMSLINNSYRVVINGFRQILNSTGACLLYPMLVENGDLIESTNSAAIINNTQNGIYRKVNFIHSTVDVAIIGQNDNTIIEDCLVISEINSAVTNLSSFLQTKRSTFIGDLQPTLSGQYTNATDVERLNITDCDVFNRGDFSCLQIGSGQRHDPSRDFIVLSGSTRFRNVGTSPCITNTISTVQNYKLMSNAVSLNNDVVPYVAQQYSIDATNVEVGDTFIHAFTDTPFPSISYVAIGGDGSLQIAQGLEAAWNAEILATPNGIYAAYSVLVNGISLEVTNIDPTTTGEWSTSGEPVGPPTWGYSSFDLTATDAGGVLVPTLTSTLIQAGEGFNNRITGTALIIDADV